MQKFLRSFGGAKGRRAATPERGAGRGGEAVVSTFPFGVKDRGSASRQHVAFERRLM